MLYESSGRLGVRNKGEKIQGDEWRDEIVVDNILEYHSIG